MRSLSIKGHPSLRLYIVSGQQRHATTHANQPAVIAQTFPWCNRPTSAHVLLSQLNSTAGISMLFAGPYLTNSATLLCPAGGGAPRHVPNVAAVSRHRPCSAEVRAEFAVTYGFAFSEPTWRLDSSFVLHSSRPSGPAGGCASRHVPDVAAVARHRPCSAARLGAFPRRGRRLQQPPGVPRHLPYRRAGQLRSHKGESSGGTLLGSAAAQRDACAHSSIR